MVNRWPAARRVAIVAIVLALFGAAVVLNRSDRPRRATVFADLGEVGIPFVPPGTQLSGSWFCPGVPRTDVAPHGAVVVANTSAATVTGNITVFSNAAGVAAVRDDFQIEAYSTTTIELAPMQPTGTFLSALVEISGGGALVEQRAVHPAGDSVAACSNAASSQWFFADGFTRGGSAETIQVTNPYEATSIINVELVTASGSFQPTSLQGMPVAGSSIATIDLSKLAQDEAVVAVAIQATRGRVVAGRMQHYVGGGRLGSSMTLGAGGLSEQYFFADQEVSDSVTTRYSVFNPGDEAIDVLMYPIGQNSADGSDPGTTIRVEANSVKTVDIGGSQPTVTNLPNGRYGMVFSSAVNTPRRFLVEQVVTRTVGGRPATTLSSGATGDTAGTRWTAVISPSGDLPAAFRILNVDNAPGIVTVRAMGANGFEQVAGMEKLEIGAGQAIALDFADLPSDLQGKPLLIDCTQRAFVERQLPRGHGLGGRSASIPLAG